MIYIILSIILGFIILSIILFFLGLNISIIRVHKSMFDKRYEPDKRITYYTKEEFNLIADKIEISLDNNKIIGYLYHNEIYDNNKLIIFCHGMYSSKESYMQEIGYISNKGFLVLGFDYLGTNESDGKLLGFGNSLKSLDAIMKYVKSNEKLKNKEIYVIGHSWGGYATGNIVKLYPDIKGIILLAPMTSIYLIAKETSSKRIHKFLPIFLNYDNKKTGGYSKYDVCESLKDYNGNVLVIQSLVDPVIPANIGINRIKEELNDKNNIEYIYPDNRLHNPDYTVDAVNYYMEFVKKSKELNELELTEYMKTLNFHEMGKLDSIIMDKCIEFIKR